MPTKTKSQELSVLGASIMRLERELDRMNKQYDLLQAEVKASSPYNRNRWNEAREKAVDLILKAAPTEPKTVRDIYRIHRGTRVGFTQRGRRA